MTLLAAWAAVLGRLSGQHEVLIGTPVASRARAELEPLIGFFVNTLVLRVDAGGRPSVAELLGPRAPRRARRPGPPGPALRAGRRDPPARRAAPLTSPLFQVMFAWQEHSDGAGLELPGLTLEPAGRGPPSAKFDLSPRHGRHRRAHRRRLQLRHRAVRRSHHRAPCRLSAGRAARHGGRRPAAAWLGIALLSDAERQLLLEDWNRTAADYPHDRCIHQLFEAQAAPNPRRHRPGVRGHERSPTPSSTHRPTASPITCERLGRRAGPTASPSVSQRSPAHGRRPARHPQGRRRLRAARPRLSRRPPRLHARGLPARRSAHRRGLRAARLPALDCTCRLVPPRSADPPWARLPATPDRCPRPRPHARHLAYVIYTSGSTGTAQGRRWSSIARVVNLLCSDAALLGLPAHDRLLSAVPRFGFDVSRLRALVCRCCAAARLVLARPSAHDARPPRER